MTLSVYVSRSNMEGPWRDVCQRVMQSVPHTETAQTTSVQRTGVSEKNWIKSEGGGVSEKSHCRLQQSCFRLHLISNVCVKSAKA